MARSAPLSKRPVRPVRPARENVLPLQAKLAVGPARDRFEAEADRVADRVLRTETTGPGLSAPPPISRLPLSAAQRVPASEAPKKVSKDIKTTKVANEEEDKSTTVQRSADGTAAAPASAESSIGRMRSAGGRPLSPGIRNTMEPGFGRPLGHVRLHDGASAANAARSVGARAFTVGNHVFFGAGQYRPETAAGRHLIAHELVHTEQQKGIAGPAQTMPLQRNATDPAADQAQDEPQDPGRVFPGSGRGNQRIELNEERTGGTIYLPSLKLPQIGGGYKGASNNPKAPGANDPSKEPLTLPYIYRGKTPRGSDTARQTFLRSEYFQAAEDQLEPALLTAIPEQVENWQQGGGIQAQDGISRHYLRQKGRRSASAHSIIIGTAEELADHPNIKIPSWNRRGRFQSYHVDHAQELQLGGLDGWANFWLLDATSNQSSGSKISNELEKDVTAIIDRSQQGNFWTGPNAGKKPTFAQIKAGNSPWQVEFAGFRALAIAGDKDFWTPTEIRSGDHLGQLQAMTENEVVAEGLVLRGDRPAAVSVFAKANGGFRRRFTVSAEGVTPDTGNENLFGGFDLISADVNSEPGTAPYIVKLNGWAFRRRNGSPLNPMSAAGENGIPVLAAPGLGFSGYLDEGALREKISAIPTSITGASPVNFTDVGVTMDGTLYADGIISSAKLLFPGLEIPIHVYGSDIFIEFPIPTDRLNFGPVSVTEAALGLGVGENGVFVSGNAALEVASVGSGTVEARVEDGNTVISGTFAFDMDFLDPAEAAIMYNYGEDTLALTLRAGVGEGRIPGVSSGEVTATFSRDAIAIDGSLHLGGALSGTIVSVTYTAEGGLEIGADNIALPVDRIPGITSATASLHARRDPASGEWTFGGSGTATIDIAGATGAITVTVDGDRITFGGLLNAARGPASGSLAFTATNAPMDDDGNIVEGPASESLSVFGRGMAEITFGRILRGSAAIELSPDASIHITGTIGLPPTFEVFPRQDYTKSLLSIETPDFPIWGVSLGGVGIGIFAFADASLSFNAYVGPGQLLDTQITADMDLDAPEDATVTGSARFTVPAYAGLNLDIGGGLRARVAVAFVEGRVGLDGELGIEADASTGVDVAWNRTDGLSVEADVEANARPKFRVGVNASVTAGVDLYLTEITETWGPWRRTLGEFGPDMEMGVRIPVRWNEQTGIDFSLDDIEVRQPQISARDILKSAFEELV